MSKRFLSVFVAATLFAAGPALACTSLQEAMGQFEEVKNAYVAKAPTMSPEQFPIWTGYLEKFGTAMGKSDFPGACAALTAASTELGFATAAAAPAAPAQPATQPAATETQEQPVPAPAPSQEPAQTASGSGQSGGLLGGSQSGSSGGGLTGGGQGQEGNGQPAQQETSVADAGEPAWVECPRGRCWLRE